MSHADTQWLLREMYLDMADSKKAHDLLDPNGSGAGICHAWFQLYGARIRKELDDAQDIDAVRSWRPHSAGESDA